MVIRKAELKDVKGCEKISNIQEFKMPDGDTPDAKFFEQSLNKIFLVAENKNEIIGLILGYQLTKEFVYLDLLTVHKNFRDKKVGHQLLLAFRKKLKKQGFKQYFLIAPTFNKQTLNFYKENGLIEGEQYTLFCDDL